MFIYIVKIFYSLYSTIQLTGRLIQNRFAKNDRLTGGKWFIQGPKHCKNNQSQSLKNRAEGLSLEFLKQLFVRLLHRP